MKTIGMIGGMSWESSKIYYVHINKMIQEKLGGSHSAKSILSSVDFQEIESMSFQGDWDGIGVRMAQHAKKVEQAGADLLILCTNTIHMVKDYIEEAIRIPFIHIADATGEAIVEAGLKNIGLLGTKFTMENDFYSDILENKYGLNTIIPDESDREVLQDMIYGELVKGNFSESSKKKCREIILKLQQQGAQGIILGCTELPILMEGEDIPIPSFDTTWLHARKAVDLSLK